jgi:hypothetical protein
MIDLQPFCETYPHMNHRHTLSSPWVMDGWRWATDGRILVRVPDEGEPEGAIEPSRPPVKQLVPDMREHPRKPWPTDGEIDYIPTQCPCINGQRFDEDEVCPFCEDTFTIFRECRVVGNHKVAMKYEKLITALPGVLYVEGIAPNAPLRFYFYGGDGTVMGMAKAGGK